MLEEKTIGVVIPAYNEGDLINKVMSTMPDFVDTMIIVNDGSADDTRDRIVSYMETDKRIVLVDHVVNSGLGQTLIDGYLKSIELKIDVVAVMAGDAQMDPDDLFDVVIPVVRDEADYVKGTRLTNANVKSKMPKYRYIGNSILTFLSKFATGYWYVIDPQCGYTAISHKAISTIPIEDMVKGYGYNAHILYMLNLANYRVKDVAVKPVYGKEQSKIKLGRYIVKVSMMLLKLFFKRLTRKYLLTDFNPLVLFYFFSFLCMPLSLFFLIRMLVIYFTLHTMPNTTLILFVFTSLMSLQSLFFAMWMDTEDNRRLRA